ncbi:DUF1178 family protein [Rhodobacteraceae bacterium 2CG4]|uniref:DUF1178 family protein n=1 Tax=Halovulum marinum TaxID=2662447 RepID=A0A6L5Z4M0_9RHOB|nr:DUF1178 family protein [Halovulum marinum]MSU91506.1 DUF1178 family protein [Halovulum marinum]
MIRYQLQCDHGHRFESWFSSSADYDRLEAAGLLACGVCGSAAVSKALMAPRVAAPDSAPTEAPTPAPQPPATPLRGPASPAEQALRALRRKIETEAENVGRDFAREARAIHEGESPRRAIYGEARGDEARALVEDGIPVSPLPWRTRTDS